jgi:hypothetical protein
MQLWSRLKRQLRPISSIVTLSQRTPLTWSMSETQLSPGSHLYTSSTLSRFAYLLCVGPNNLSGFLILSTWFGGDRAIHRVRDKLGRCVLDGNPIV